MNLFDLRPGDKVRTIDGAVAEIVRETEDGQWVLVRYLDSADSALVGTQDLCHQKELQEVTEKCL